MHAFHLERRMTSMLGGFYPTGHLFIMLPSRQQAEHAEALLIRGGCDCSDVSLLTPEDVQEVVHMFDGHDLLLPSVGTEEDTARHFAELALRGHHALLVPARNAQCVQSVMDALREVDVSCAVRYRYFVIEDLVV